jgi:hypothetical protein
MLELSKHREDMIKDIIFKSPTNLASQIAVLEQRIQHIEVKNSIKQARLKAELEPLLQLCLESNQDQDKFTHNVNNALWNIFNILYEDISDEVEPRRGSGY